MESMLSLSFARDIAAMGATFVIFSLSPYLWRSIRAPRGNRHNLIVLALVYGVALGLAPGLATAKPSAVSDPLADHTMANTEYHFKVVDTKVALDLLDHTSAITSVLKDVADRVKSTRRKASDSDNLAFALSRVIKCAALLEESIIAHAELMGFFHEGFIKTNVKLAMPIIREVAPTKVDIQNLQQAASVAGAYLEGLISQRRLIYPNFGQLEAHIEKALNLISTTSTIKLKRKDAQVLVSAWSFLGGDRAKITEFANQMGISIDFASHGRALAFIAPPKHILQLKEKLQDRTDAVAKWTAASPHGVFKV
ncbi:hypothetical protein BOTBODRAFT_62917 [Botryobasidium botryosum FD-172 SS1]|uniref:Uncharacterized protein n=1 Tax=Botryobasidium botryosum (strain FD-172 SS1) TaxID=930990 RepID=A0A067N640_BOTB1|nr:hypothetical protein BOTBODRAFT_62917 [Botryobasidium botryosum FD-172 SS1]